MSLITKRLTMLLILVGFISPLWAMSSDGVRSVEVFTITGMPPQNMPPIAVLVEIDAAGRLDALLSEQLPDEPEQAIAYMQTVMSSQQWHDISQQLKKAYTGLARAKQLGIEKIPAIVINSEFVVYGDLDVESVVREYIGSAR